VDDPDTIYVGAEGFAFLRFSPLLLVGEGCDATQSQEPLLR
jgi:hypothetical protein